MAWKTTIYNWKDPQCIKHWWWGCCELSIIGCLSWLVPSLKSWSQRTSAWSREKMGLSNHPVINRIQFDLTNLWMGQRNPAPPIWDGWNNPNKIKGCENHLSTGVGYRHHPHYHNSRLIQYWFHLILPDFRVSSHLHEAKLETIQCLGIPSRMVG